MDTTLLLINGAGFMVVGVAFIFQGVRGMQDGAKFTSLQLGTNPPPGPEKLRLRSRFLSVGLGSSMLTVGALELGRGLVFIFRSH